MLDGFQFIHMQYYETVMYITSLAIMCIYECKESHTTIDLELLFLFFFKYVIILDIVFKP